MGYCLFAVSWVVSFFSLSLTSSLPTFSSLLFIRTNWRIYFVDYSLLQSTDRKLPKQERGRSISGLRHHLALGRSPQFGWCNQAGTPIHNGKSWWRILWNEVPPFFLLMRRLFTSSFHRRLCSQLTTVSVTSFSFISISTTRNTTSMESESLLNLKVHRKPLLYWMVNLRERKRIQTLLQSLTLVVIERNLKTSRENASSIPLLSS